MLVFSCSVLTLLNKALLESIFIVFDVLFYISYVEFRTTLKLQ